MSKKKAKILLAICIPTLIGATGGLAYVMYAISSNSAHVPPWSVQVLSAIFAISPIGIGMAIGVLTE